MFNKKDKAEEEISEVAFEDLELHIISPVTFESSWTPVQTLLQELLNS